MRKAIATHQEQARAAAEVSSLKADLGELSEHMDLDALRTELESADLEAIDDELAQLEIEKAAKQDAVETCIRNEQSTREELDKLSSNSGDTQQQLEADRQMAISEMADTAGAYIRTRMQHLLLRAGVEHYRTERDTPVLDRASELVQRHTDGSLQGLAVNWEDPEKPILVGLRDNQDLAIESMSEGTQDALYLSLRIAAIEDRLSRTAAVPFIGDDIFIQMDNDRTGRAFKQLAELGRHTQVIYFTHHHHLIDVAHDAIGQDVNVIEL